MTFVYGVVLGAAIVGVLAVVFNGKLDALHAKIDSVLAAVKK